MEHRGREPRAAPEGAWSSRACALTHQPLHALHVGRADGQGLLIPPLRFIHVPAELGHLAPHVQDVVGHWEEVGSFLGTGCGFRRLPKANVDFSCGGRAESRCCPSSWPERGPVSSCHSAWDLCVPPWESSRALVPHPLRTGCRPTSLMPIPARDSGHLYCETGRALPTSEEPVLRVHLGHCSTWPGPALGSDHHRERAEWAQGQAHRGTQSFTG